jgi:MoaA/NifB/PqqE/SkfB family radical SAM enzyme
MSKLLNLIDYRNLKPCNELTKRSRLFTGYGCNIKCKFCFYKDEKHKDIKSLIYQQLEQGKRYGIKDWDISGGEPSILPYWVDLLKDMKNMEFRNIACITNGYKFANLDFLVDSKIAGLNELLFSVHGSTAEIHDGMTGVKGSFDKIWKALSNAWGFGMKIRINVVVTKDNYKDLINIAKLVMKFAPKSFNFLPFRIENSADKENSIRYSQIANYIKETIDFIDDDCKVAIRYVPFCLFEGYEKYVAGYLQRVFDEYEWNEYTIRKFDCVRFKKDVPILDCETDKWELEIDALNKSIKHVAGHSINCLKCKYMKVCDGIWKSYADIWGIDEFHPIKGEKIECILLN